MMLSRRTLMGVVPVATLLGVAGLAACSDDSGESTGSSAAATPLATTDVSLALDSAAWNYDADGDVYYQLGLSYVASPQDTGYETLGVFVPGAYMSAVDNGDGTFTAMVASDGAVGDWTATTAPIVLPVNTPGYAAQQPPSEYSYDTISAYMEAGFIYVQAGLRGKDSTTDAAPGNAPWGVTDLKAAVRYLRYNSASLPGNPEQVYVFGHSGGGAQSAVMGASGDSALYTPYLEALGAATTDTDGAALSDAIAGAMCWCPITSLDAANAAYEWNMGQFATTGTRAEGTWTQAYSQDLAAAYAGYLNGLGLVDADGNTLTLEESDGGQYLAGSYYDHMVAVVEQSLNDFLANTEFPYTPNSTEMAGMESQGGSGAPEGGPSGSTGDASAVPSGSPGDGQAPDGAPTDGASGGPDGDSATAGAGGPGDGSSADSSESVTYETVEDYIAALNEDVAWVSYDSSTNTATVTGLEGFVTSQKTASKDVGALDGVDRGQTENTVLWVGDTALHFSELSRDVIAANQDAYASLRNWSEDYGAEGYDSDFKQTDAQGVNVLTREHMYNPMYFLSSAYEGAGTSTVAPNWRIRTGITQGDTASTVEVNLALALQAAGQSVDFATIWGQGHTMAELTGTGEENFISWVAERAAS
ncbi:Carboxylesterase family protein [Actinomyces ruminicola]|uniref:Carboxylesterase family protein n=1 Tax=Actinomyces ruminicola TaxID=332524 RepID=A0A1H0EQA6_9ACTO|nr:subtype A tannase [Actinomyces ruminicola]SDN84584.1 Carboxylesterase family protein [Actinomyces ruminicola]